MGVELQEHPYLRELEEAERAAAASGGSGEETPPTPPEEPAPAAPAPSEEPSEAVQSQTQIALQVPEPPAEPPASQEPPAPETHYLDTLDYSSVEEVLKHPHAGPLFQTAIGRAASRQARTKYEPQIAELRQENARLTAKLKEAVTQDLTPEQMSQRYYSDEEFRKLHDAQPESPEDIQREFEVNSAIARKVEKWAIHMPKEWIDRALGELGSGRWDRVDNRVLTPSESLDYFDDHLGRLAQYYAQQRQQQQAAARPVPPPAPAPPVAAVPPAPPPPAPEAPRPNPALARSGPDVSPGGGSSSVAPMRLSEYERLTPPQKYAMFPNDGDFGRALASGRIVRD